MTVGIVHLFMVGTFEKQDIIKTVMGHTETIIIQYKPNVIPLTDTK